MGADAEPGPDEVALPWGFEDLRGQVVGERYVVDEIVGASAQRVAFGGRDQREDGRAVVVTVLQPATPYDEPTVERFERRVAACGRVRHPAVMGPTDHGELRDGKLYLVTDRPPGEPLDRLVAGSSLGRLPWAEARPLLLELVQGIGAAHARKVVHCALSPRCCWVERPDCGEPSLRVIDFGANTSPETAETNRVSSQTMTGGPDSVYMAPEAAGGLLGDERSDAYLVGLVAWFVLVGRPPFDGVNPFQLAAEHANAPVPAMASCGAQVPEAVEAWALRLLGKKPDARPGSMAEIEQALRELDESGRVVDAPRTAEPEPARGRKARARARRARAAAQLGDAGARSRDEAVDRIRGGAASTARARKLPGQEIVDPRVAVPRREVVFRPMAPPPSAVAPVAAPVEADGIASPSRGDVAPPYWSGEQRSDGVEATMKLSAVVPETEATMRLQSVAPEIDATMRLQPGDPGTEASDAPIPSPPTQPDPMSLTKEQVRALRARLSQEPLAPGPAVGTVTPSEAQSGTTPVITGATERVSPEQVRALRKALSKGHDDPGSSTSRASAASPDQDAAARPPSKEQRDSTLDRGPPADKEAQILSSNNFALPPRSIKRPGSGSKRG